MSINNKRQLYGIAKKTCRELRKRSTEAEMILWERVRNRKLCSKKFLRQHPLFYNLDGKESFFVADFYCDEEKLIVELDGEYHQFRITEDNNRTKILNLLGLQVIRFDNDQVLSDVDKILSEIKATIDSSP